MLFNLKTEMGKYKDLSIEQFDQKIRYKGLHIKKDEQLNWLTDFYPKKIERLKRLISNIVSDGILFAEVGDIKEEIEFLLAKMRRLAEKYTLTLKEQEFRKKEKFERHPVGTIYYIDLDGGNDGNDGLSTGQAWLTIEKYTSVTVRTPGDIGKVRANTDEIPGAADIVADEDGDKDNYIEIRGCSIADDPWGDSSDIKPIIDWNSQDYQLKWNGDNYWKFNKIEIKNTGDIYGNFYLLYTAFCYIKDCKFTGGIFRGIRLLADFCLIEGCEFESNTSYNVEVGRWFNKFKDCIFNGGAAPTSSRGITNSGIMTFLENCSFGQTTSHGNWDVYMDIFGTMKRINCILDKGDGFSGDYKGSAIFDEDYNGNRNARIQTLIGIITKETTIVRPGGADSSAKMMPNSNCGLINPLTLAYILFETDFTIWCPASQKTITIYIRSEGAWGTYPTNTELYIEANYLNAGSGGSRTTIKSTQILSDATTWIAFTVNFTPSQAGWVYIKVFLKKYEAGKGCYVDIKPIVA